MRSMRSVETCAVLRLRMAVRRVRDVSAVLATWAWVRPETATTWMILLLIWRRTWSSAASAGERLRARASSVALRVIMGLVFGIEKFLQAFLCELGFGWGRFWCFFLERVEDEDGPVVFDDIESAVDARGIFDSEFAGTGCDGGHRTGERQGEKCAVLEVKDCAAEGDADILGEGAEGAKRSGVEDRGLHGWIVSYLGHWIKRPAGKMRAS